jgi:hypothetical protein
MLPEAATIKVESRKILLMGAVLKPHLYRVKRLLDRFLRKLLQQERSLPGRKNRHWRVGVFHVCDLVVVL